MTVNKSIDFIFVPQGIEYQAVCQGLNRVDFDRSRIISIPIGVQPVKNFLQRLQLPKLSIDRQHLNILLMGLCGSLSPQYRVGDVVLYRDCIYKGNQSILKCRTCDRQLNDRLGQILDGKISLVRGFTSDQVLVSRLEKQQMNSLYNLDVVDMEGFSLLENIEKLNYQTKFSVSMLRVVSDDCHRDIPDLNGSIDDRGNLQFLPLALSFMQKPLSAAHFIGSSLKGLKTLQALTQQIFSSLDR